jgi:predicted PurR-regulated permease PerM
MNTNKLIDFAPVALAMILLLVGAALILLPFLPQIIWAAILVYVTRHIYWRFDALLGRRHILSATILVFLMVSLIIVPIIYGVAVLSVEATAYVETIRGWFRYGVPALPRWIIDLPWVGDSINQYWQQLLGGDPELQQNLKDAVVWLANMSLKLVGLFGQDIGLLLLSMIIAGFIYASLDKSANWLEAVMAKLYPTRSDELLKIIGGTVQGVVFGILGTALAQALLMVIGLFIADIPSVALLGGLTFVLSLIPGGPVLIWLPAAAWLYHQGHSSLAIFMVIWGAGVVSSIDNFLKPILIGKGSDLPMLLIFLGMFGGALSFGILGIFIGPTLLALAYTLLKDWAFMSHPELEKISSEKNT